MGLKLLDTRIHSAASACNGEKISLMVEYGEENFLILNFSHDQDIDLITALNKASKVAAQQRGDSHESDSERSVVPTSMKLIWLNDGRCILQIGGEDGGKLDVLFPEAALESLRNGPNPQNNRDLIRMEKSPVN